MDRVRRARSSELMGNQIIHIMRRANVWNWQYSLSVVCKPLMMMRAITVARHRVLAALSVPLGTPWKDGQGYMPLSCELSPSSANKPALGSCSMPADLRGTGGGQESAPLSTPGRSGDPG